MNQKTAKILTRYASLTKRKVREIKREWLALNSQERDKLRKTMEKEIAE